LFREAEVVRALGDFGLFLSFLPLSLPLLVLGGGEGVLQLVAAGVCDVKLEQLVVVW